MLQTQNDARSDEAQERRQRHPLAIQWGPPPEDERSPEFVAQRDDIKENGLRHPIILYEDMVLCGWTRHRGCLAAGVKPLFRHFVAKDGETKADTDRRAVKLIRSDDYKRRHMTYLQKARIALSQVNSRRGGDRRSAAVTPIKPAQQGFDTAQKSVISEVEHPPEIVTMAMAAADLGINLKYLEETASLLKKAQASVVWPKIETALNNGKITTREIKALIAQSAEEQQKTVRMRTWEFNKLLPRLAKEYQPERKQADSRHVVEKIMRILESHSQIGRRTTIEALVRLGLDGANQVLLVDDLRSLVEGFEREQGA
jgi:hypothetical protein